MSTLTLTFSGITPVNVDERVIVTVSTVAGNIQFIETFKSARTRNFETAIPNPYTRNDIAQNFADAWNLDYRLSGIENSVVASVVENVVTITLNVNTWNFVSVTGEAIDSGAVTSSLVNDPIEVEKTASITSYTAHPTNKCTEAVANITARGGNNSYNVYLDNVLVQSAQTSPLAVDVPRQDFPSVIRIVDTLGADIATLQTVSLRSLIESDINIKVKNLPSGSTVTFSANYISPDVSNYEWSLNGVTYQTENVFTGQAAGSYAVYLRDGLGCVTTKEYVVDGVTEVTETVFTISNINALRFAKVDDEKKNQLNTLSFNELRLSAYPYYQKFLSTDTITTQFKTNAQYIRAFKIDCDQNETDLVVTKKTNNIGLQEKTTCTYFDAGNGRSGVYFGVVNRLNFLTEAVIEQVNYGNALPQWADKEGDYITLSGLGEIEIDAIEYSEVYNSFVITFPIAFSGATSRIVSATYSIQPYEIYEFSTAVDIDRFNVAIQVGTDANNIDFTYLSETIKQVSDYDRLYEIEYWDDENIGGFNYQTGIKNKLRIEGYQDNIGEQETEGYNGDQEYYVTDNVIYDVQRFEFNRLSNEIANKLRLVVAHKYLKINGLFYKLAESPEVQGEKYSNMKTFVVNLKQGGEKFLTDAQEIITDSPQQLQIGSTLNTGVSGSPILWTKGS